MGGGVGRPDGIACPLADSSDHDVRYITLRLHDAHRALARWMGGCRDRPADQRRWHLDPARPRSSMTNRLPRAAVCRWATTVEDALQPAGVTTMGGRRLPTPRRGGPARAPTLVPTSTIADSTTAPARMISVVEYHAGPHDRARPRPRRCGRARCPRRRRRRPTPGLSSDRAVLGTGSDACRAADD